MKTDVRITPDTTQKFVLAHGTNKDGEECFLLWGNPNVEWHKDIVEEMLDTWYVDLQIIGGGKIQVLTDSKVIYVWGKSSRYGAVPEEVIREIIEKTFPNHSLLFKEPDGVV